ncbi:osmoprotectant transport system permease protein [Frigoribacterium sp. PhB107]|uniref:ABC transporter permease n=1 Tax=Frigoribacterium sp. PhB107 TaxID=2485172 RepID=UPI000F4986AB|nr:ABC transporter permease [Frigoribacterium sp. PhB107]ROP73011.1 osmoprotectant transport system permease protein [Frigoribacterium sp. PhB107]
MIQYLQNNVAVIQAALSQHVFLALVPVLIGIVVSLPIGYLAVRFGFLYHPLLNLSGILYAVPSIALIVLVPTIVGIQILSPLNIIIALSVYTIALLVRVVADGLKSVDPLVTEAASAMGYRRLRRLVSVELPISLPVMLAGLRVATVANVSLVSVGALIGVGGLGALFTRGQQLNYTPPIVVGIVLSVLLAAVCDGIIVLVQRRVTPWTRVAGRIAA